MIPECITADFWVTLDISKNETLTLKADNSTTVANIEERVNRARTNFEYGDAHKTAFVSSEFLNLVTFLLEKKTPAQRHILTENELRAECIRYTEQLEDKVGDEENVLIAELNSALYEDLWHFEFFIDFYIQNFDMVFQALQTSKETTFTYDKFYVISLPKQSNSDTTHYAQVEMSNGIMTSFDLVNNIKDATMFTAQVQANDFSSHGYVVIPVYNNLCN